MLSDIKVLDLSRVLAGPWATQMLADMGAEVIKVEHPKGGDDTRSWGPPFIDQERGLSAYFTSANRGKKSVCVDLKTEAGQQQIKQLAKASDVLVENFKVGGTADYGLGYEALSAENPRLIYCSISGFGQTGPRKDQLGYDFLVQAMGGLMSVTGSTEGEPSKVGVALSDVMTGLYASSAILAALHEREKSGLGQHIDLSLLDVTAATLANQASNYLVSGQSPERMGNAHPNIAPYQSFNSADNDFIVAVGNDQQFVRLCNVVNLPELGKDKRFITNQERVRNRTALTELLQQALLAKPSNYWIQQLENADVPAAPVNDIEGVFNDPQIIAREMRLNLSSGDSEIPIVANPIKFSRTPIQYSAAPPALGEHSDQILSDLEQD